MSIYFDNFGPKDIEIIKKQLNSDDVYISGIYKRCSFGFPQVVFLNPIKVTENGNKFNYDVISNIMWLTCPYLNEKIHELENQSYIEKIEELIGSNCSYYEKMQRAHAGYYFLRNIIFRKYVDSIKKKKWMDLSRRGIGGVRNLHSIKCLHLHFCHFCVYKENLAGRITYSLLDKKTVCDDNICGCL